MKITHLASSAQIIHCGSSAVLTDPWLVDGEYFGSWFHAPPYVGPIAELRYDCIYVSHIHPDHFSRKTFRLLSRDKPVLIHNYHHKFLRASLEAMGFTVIELDHNRPYELNDGRITILGADNCNPVLCSRLLGCGAIEAAFGSTQIDSIALFEDRQHVLVNINDAPFTLASDALNVIMKHVNKVDCLLVGYAGAGPYPQCFTFPDGLQMAQAATQKKRRFLEQALDYIRALKPKYYIPFAGTYVLGGRLAEKNRNRGMPDLREAGAWLRSRVEEEHLDSCLIQLNSLATLDLANPGIVDEFRPWSSEQSQRYSDKKLSALPYDFDDVISPTRSQLEELFSEASRRFFAKKRELRYVSDFVLAIVISAAEVALFELGADEWMGIVEKRQAFEREKYVVITLDPKLLFWLLRGPTYAHWGDAEIGSHLMFERRPDVMERQLYHCICSLHA
jgi:UDP-MurNAc hydroxylase